jgi:hypothetical protein
MPTPTELADAEVRRQQLTLEIQGIQAQLGDKQRTDEQGRRLTAQEYWSWKKRAQHALNQKLDELRALKSWLKEHRATSFDEARKQAQSTSVDTAVHLENLLSILRDLKNEDVDFDLDELNKMEAAQRALDRLRAQGNQHGQDQDIQSQVPGPNAQRA